MGSARSALAAGIAVIAGAWIAFGIPFVSREVARVESVAQPRPKDVVSLVGVPPRQRACIGPVTLTTDARELEFTVGTFGRPAVPLRVSVVGPGHRAVRGVPANSYADNATLHVPLPRAARDEIVTVCIANRGGRAVALYGGQRAAARARTAVAGQLAFANVALSSSDTRPTSLWHRRDEVARRAVLFDPRFVSPMLVRLLLLLSVLVVPVALVVTLALSLRPRAEGS